MKGLTFVLAAGLSLLAGAASAQITIEAGDVPTTIGDSCKYKYVQGEATVSNGSPGGPQTWTFDTSTYVGYVLTTTIVDKATTPFADRFPDANLATREPRGPYTLYVYNKVAADGLYECGYGLQFGGGTKVIADVPPAKNVAFPATFGTSWQTDYTVYDTIGGDTVQVAVTSRRCIIDAWGTANTPAGNFDCLRENWTGPTVTTTYVGGSPVEVDTSIGRRYLWMAKGVGAFAWAHSLEGDTSLNFTQADDYTVMVQTSSGGVEEPGQRVAEPRFAVRPNPCGRLATVELACAAPGTVTVSDVAGRSVLSQEVSTRTAALDLSGVPAGVYVVTLDSGGRTTSRPLVRLQ